MKEMENIPRDNNKRNDILVDEDEIEKKNQGNDSKNVINSQDIILNVQSKDNQIHQNYYLSQIFYKNFSLNIIILLSLIILIMLEFIYRRPLFNYSLAYEQNPKFFAQKWNRFYKLISLLGRWSINWFRSLFCSMLLFLS